jgi:hypothetical protein
VIKEYVPSVPSELTFYIEECGFRDWEERRHRPVIIPAEAGANTLKCPVNWHIRHHSLICFITAAGDPYCPSPVSSGPLATRIFESGVRKGIDVRVESSRCSYPSKAFFPKYVGAVPTPAVKSKRRLLSCEKKPVLLFCYGCRAHCSDEVLTKLVQNGVITIADPLRIPHVFQVLDVLLFGVLKRAKNTKEEMIH